MSLQFIHTRDLADPSDPVARDDAYHHGNLKQALLDAGAVLIEQEGISGVSLRAVAKEAGVSHSAPYRHFKDKNAMLRGIAATGFEILGRRLLQAVQVYPESPENQLISAGVAYVELAIESPQRHNLMFGGALPNDESDRSLEETSNTSLRGLANIIRHGQARGVFREGNPDDLALAAWSLVHGFAMLATTGKLDRRAASKPDKLNLASTVASDFVRGLREGG